MVTLRLARAAASVLFVALFFAIWFSQWFWVSRDPRLPHGLHRYPFPYKPTAYLTHSDAFVGYGLLLAWAVVAAVLIVLSVIQHYRRR